MVSHLVEAVCHMALPGFLDLEIDQETYLQYLNLQL